LGELSPLYDENGTARLYWEFGAVGDAKAESFIALRRPDEGQIVRRAPFNRR